MKSAIDDELMTLGNQEESDSSFASRGNFLVLAMFITALEAC